MSLFAHLALNHGSIEFNIQEMSINNIITHFSIIGIQPMLKDKYLLPVIIKLLTTYILLLLIKLDIWSPQINHMLLTL